MTECQEFGLGQEEHIGLDQLVDVMRVVITKQGNQAIECQPIALEAIM